MIMSQAYFDIYVNQIGELANLYAYTDKKKK